MRSTNYRVKILVLLIFLGHGVAFSESTHAEDNARLTASSLVLEQTADGIILNLTGPVEVEYKGDTITSESAIVTLGDDLSNLTSAISQIDLTGDVRYSGRNGSSGSASSATYYAQRNRIILRGGVNFSQGGLNATAGSVDYSITGRQVIFQGRCSLNEGDISASADTAEYNLSTRSGTLSGSVEVRYRTSGVIFWGEEINEVILRASELNVSASENHVMTPAGSSGGGIVLVAGNFTLHADNIDFSATESDFNSVTVVGNVNLSGPDGQYLNAEHLSISNADRFLRAEGNVGFSILGQEGSAESIEVNFTENWGIRNLRMIGGSVGGVIEDEGDQ